MKVLNYVISKLQYELKLYDKIEISLNSVFTIVRSIYCENRKFPKVLLDKLSFVFIHCVKYHNFT